MKRYFSITVFAFAALLLLLAGGCSKIDNKVLPQYAVRINLGDYARWNTYGVAGIGDYRVFNREKKLPANFPYDVNTFTGFGGVLLFKGLDASSGDYAPIAFDMACPVEGKQDVLIRIDGDNFDAVCDKCKSRYDVLQGSGGPKSGMAVTQKVGLTMYRAHSSGGGYIITNY